MHVELLLISLATGIVYVFLTAAGVFQLTLNILRELSFFLITMSEIAILVILASTNLLIELAEGCLIISGDIGRPLVQVVSLCFLDFFEKS